VCIFLSSRCDWSTLISHLLFHPCLPQRHLVCPVPSAAYSLHFHLGFMRHEDDRIDCRMPAPPGAQASGSAYIFRSSRYKPTDNEFIPPWLFRRPKLSEGQLSKHSDGAKNIRFQLFEEQRGKTEVYPWRPLSSFPTPSSLASHDPIVRSNLGNISDYQLPQTKADQLHHGKEMARPSNNCSQKVKLDSNRQRNQARYSAVTLSKSKVDPSS